MARTAVIKGNRLTDRRGVWKILGRKGRGILMVGVGRKNKGIRLAVFTEA